MSSVLPSSFSWGFSPRIPEDPKDKLEQQQASKPLNMINSSSNNSSSGKMRKRQLDDNDNDNDNDNEHNSSSSEAVSPSVRRHHHHSSSSNKRDKFRITKNHFNNKKIKVPKIIGQQLPPNRIIEVLDKQNLQLLLTNLINLHPELNQDIYNCSPKPTISSSISILSDKVSLVLDSLPYKVDQSSEYAYLRVKPLIEDFLNALSDYTLQFLPPVEPNPINSLEFLDQATSLLHKLPNFKSLSNNYFKIMAYEQISNTWCICLKEFVSNNSSENHFNNTLIYLINNNWEQKLKKHNELSGNSLSKVIEFFKLEILSSYEESIVSNYQQNFSSNNSPIHGLKNNLLDGFRQ